MNETPTGTLKGRLTIALTGEGLKGGKTTMETTVLSFDEVSAILANTRDRGGAKRHVTSFVDSGELYKDLKTIPGNDAKKVDSLYNSYNSNIKKMSDEAKAANKPFPALKVVKTGEGDDETVILINLDVHAAQKSEAA